MATATRQTYSLEPTFTVSDLKRSVVFDEALGFTVTDDDGFKLTIANRE